MTFVPRVLGLLLLAGFALAASVRVYPTSPPEREAKPGELVTHVFRVEGEGGPYPVEVQSGAGFPILSRPQPVRPPRYLPITLRVPEDAREGTLDLLTVRIAGAEARVRTRVGYRPGLRLDLPARLYYEPPYVTVRVRVTNAGNGTDTLSIRVRRGGRVVRERTARLGPGSALSFSWNAARPGAFQVEARLARAGIVLRRTVVVEPPPAGFSRPLYLEGRIALGYAWPSSSVAGSFSLAGSLSDYLFLASALSWGGWGLPQARLYLLSEEWSAEVWAGSYTAGRLALWEGPVRVDFELETAPELRYRAELGWQEGSQRHGFGVSGGEGFALRLTGSGGGRLHWSYAVEYLPLPGVGRVQGVISGSASGFGWSLGWDGERSPGGWRVGTRLGLSARRQSLGAAASLDAGGLRDWRVAYASSGERPWSLGLEAGSTGLSGELWLRGAGGLELELTAGWPWTEGPYAEAAASWDLAPFGRASFELRLDREGIGGGLGFRSDTRYLYPEAFGGTPLGYGLGLRLGWPLEESLLGIEARLGDDVAYLGGSLDLRPFEPGGRAALEAALPLARVQLIASAVYRWPEGSASASLGARYPFRLQVPPDWVAFFGGRKVARVTGRFLPDAPVPPGSLEGIRVEADGVVAETDREGRFVLELPPGKRRLRVDPASLPALFVPAFLERELTLRARETVALEIPLEVRARLVGRIRVEGGDPGGLGVPVLVEDARGRVIALSAAGGRFELSGLRPGRYRVRLPAERLPPGYRPVRGEVEVELRPGREAAVELVVAAPPRRAFRPVPVSILAVEPEAERVPPGSAPLVEVRVRGGPERVALYLRDRILGWLAPTGEEGLWRGRVPVPRDRAGIQVFEVVAERTGSPRARYPFLLDVDPEAPWGTLETPFLVRPGSRRVPARVHLLAPAREVVLWVGDRRFPLAGAGADWQGAFEVPESARGRLVLRVQARLWNDAVVELARVILVR